MQFFVKKFFGSYFSEFRGYSLNSLSGDLTAGISVALLGLPQAMAYALVAGLPLSTSLFAAIFSSMIAAIFCSSRHLVIGPSNAIAILIQYGTSEILHNHFRDLVGAEREWMAFQVMTQLTLLIAFLHLLAATFRLGRLTQFVSFSVVKGYLVGAAVAITINQLFVFLGLPSLEGVVPLYRKTFYILTHFHQLHWATAFLGSVSLGLLLYFNRLKMGSSAALITVAAAGFLAFLGTWVFSGAFEGVLLVGDVGDLSSVRPMLAAPFFRLSIMNDLLPIAFAVALLAILETTSVSKSVASRSGQHLSINQEILGLGMANLTSAFCGAMPVSGSASRTTLNFESGAQSRLAALFGAAIVGGILYLFSGWVVKVPLAALSAILFLTALNLIKKDQVLLCIRSTASDRWVFWVTFLSCVLFGIDVAFYIGVCLSITLYLNRAAVPQVLEYIVDQEGRIKSIALCLEEELTAIRFIKVKGELFFGAADLFHATLKSIAEDDTNTKVIILQLKEARDLDATGCLALKQLHAFMKSNGRFLLISGISASVAEILYNSGVTNAIGEEYIFKIDPENPRLYIDAVIEKAQELLEEDLEEKEEGAVEEPYFTGSHLNTSPEGSVTVG